MAATPDGGDWKPPAPIEPGDIWPTDLGRTGFTAPPTVEINGKLSPDDIKVIKQSKAKLKLKVGKSGTGTPRVGAPLQIGGGTHTAKFEGDSKLKVKKAIAKPAPPRKKKGAS